MADAMTTLSAVGGSSSASEGASEGVPCTCACAQEIVMLKEKLVEMAEDCKGERFCHL